MGKTQRVLVSLLTAVIIGLGAYVLYSWWFSPTEEIYFPERNISFNVDVATTEAEHAQGLSGRDTLAEGSGMWFEFSDEAPRTFWMKDMRFPIDIIWLDGEMRITGLEREVAPPPATVTEEQLVRYTSPPDTQYVLEINAGTVDEAGLKPGDKAVRR